MNETFNRHAATDWISSYLFRMGFPEVIISDQGREFNSKVVDEICSLLGMDHRNTSAYHPQTNGLTGTVVLLFIIKIFVNSSF